MINIEKTLPKEMYGTLKIYLQSKKRKEEIQEFLIMRRKFEITEDNVFLIFC